MTNIVCLKWGTKFSPDYVNNLYAGFKRNVTVPFKFFCVTENPAGLNSEINIIPLPKLGLEGWWNKVWMFSKDFPIQDRVVFADLDTLIVGNVDHLITHEADLLGCKDFYNIIKNVTTFQSSFMSFVPAKLHHVWDNFYPKAKQIAQQMHPMGDQVWIDRQTKAKAYWQDMFPNQVVSYKVACLKGIPPDARVICYHGRPSIIESFTMTVTAQSRVCTPQLWVKDHWRP
jgi:hypothetical protein